MTIYHGSKVIVEKPLFGYGRTDNDYGQGFYCTEDIELAKEWSCQDPEGGFVNSYELDPERLRVYEIDSNNIISWIAILLSNRMVRYSSPIEKRMAEYIAGNFAPDISGYDVIRGFRADDSYFSIARSFLSNTVSLEQLRSSLELGQLGMQVCLKSRKSFDTIKFCGSEPVDGNKYYRQRISRDNRARDDFYKMLEHGENGGIYVRDIIEKEMTEDELRIS